MELHKENSVEDAVKRRRRATKDEPMEPVTTVEDAVSGVADQTQKPSTGNDMILGILKTQANQIQALIAVVAQHDRVLELLTSLNVSATSDNKPMMNLNLNLHPTGGVHLYTNDGTLEEPVKEVTNGGTLSGRTPTRQQCPPPKPEDVIRGISAPMPTTMAGVNKGKSGTPQPAPQVNLQRKLSFKDEGNSTKDLIRNIRSTGPGSPWTFYTHRSADIRSEETPKCLDLSFWPPAGMKFVSHELAIAAYIFANGLQPSEILVENEHCTGNREALWTLRPGEEVVDDVINLVVAMVSSNKAEKQRWWLPTTFAIYVPFHMRRHWYLMIVDMWDEKLIYLDSLKSTVERQARIDQMMEVARLLELLLTDTSSYECKTTVSKSISNNDCGVWVAEWMIQYDLWASYDLQVINEHTRMTIAVDLVMGEHNPISEEVQQKAVQFWDRNMICSYMKGARPRKRTRSPVGPLSP
ncbi:Ulp1 protease family, carboxy-terminal domain protein [Arachis hypogaea]|nr:Ulp1 protease family, carboxy-terminal domain protein [Arachis hypogaea]